VISSLELTDQEAALEDAIKAWKKAQLLYAAPAWENQPEARAMVEKLATQPSCEESLYALLSDANQYVVAYSLMTLELMGSSKLRILPETLLENRSNVSFSIGSVRTSMDLGGYARQIKKRAMRSA
jgi:hypothetical protein